MNPSFSVLAPVDLAAGAEIQVRHAINVAAGLGADLILLYVAGARRLQPERPVEWPANAMADPSCRIRRMVLPGPVAETISSCAELTGADLVALTTRHDSSWSRFWSKSGALEIANSTDKPVCITAAASVQPDRRFHCRRVLCLLALNGTDEAVVLQAEALAERSGGEIMLLHVLPDENGFACGIPGVQDHPLRERAALRHMRRLAADLAVPHTKSVVTGSAHKSIARAVNAYGADVMVAARPAQSDDLELRSLLRRSHRPLVSVAATAPAYHVIRERVGIRGLKPA